MKKILLAAIIIASSTMGHAQIKQRSAIKGFNAAASIHTLGWTSTYFEYLDKNSPSGYGGGLRVSYGITEMFEPYLGFDVTSLGKKDIDAQSFSMTHTDIGLRVNFAGTVHPVRPFIEAGYTYLSGKVKQVINGTNHVDLDFYGGKPHVGGGLNYLLKVPISLFAEGIFTIGKKSSAKIDGTVIPDKPDVTTFRINLGVKLNISELSK